jgi:uncharacterized membrane protein
LRKPVLEFSRLTNLADGIFAVAMTFLAFTIQLPAAGGGPDGGLAGKLSALLPQLLLLAISYVISARCWVLHYRMLCFLFGIILVPFSADVLGNFPLSPVSVSVYAANGAFISMMLTMMWSYALYHPLILSTDDARREGWHYLTLSTVSTFGFLVSVGVAQFSPRLAIACWPGILLPGQAASRWLSVRLITAAPVMTKSQD